MLNVSTYGHRHKLSTLADSHGVPRRTVGVCAATVHVAGIEITFESFAVHINVRLD